MNSLENPGYDRFYFIPIPGDETRQRGTSGMAKGLLLKPSVLLYNDSIPERAYYPQIGCLVNWLFDTYGVEKINRIVHRTALFEKLNSGLNRKLILVSAPAGYGKTTLLSNRMG